MNIGRRFPRTAGLIVLFALLVAACSRTGTPMEVNGVTLLRYGFMTGFPTAAREGELRIKDGCFWIESQVGAGPQLAVSLVLWPSSARLSIGDGEVHIDIGDLSLGDGDLVTLGGGEYTAAYRGFVEELVGPLPEQCPSDSYWLASGAELGFTLPD